MSAVCGIYSPRQPDRASKENLGLMTDALADLGEIETSFADASRGVAMALLYSPTFVAPEENAVPTWHEDEGGVVAMAGTLDEVFDDQSGISKQAAFLKDAFKRHPDAFPDGIEGSFSLASWDRATGDLVVASDPLADKLYYYYYEPNQRFLPSQAN